MYSILNNHFPKIGEKELFSSIQCLDTHPIIVSPGLGVLKLAIKVLLVCKLQYVQLQIIFKEDQSIAAARAGQEGIGSLTLLVNKM